MAHERIKGNLDMLLLAAVSHGPAHGYEIITRLRQRSDGEFDLAEGTVYPALHRLEHSGLIDSSWQTVDGRRRRVYQLNGVGQDALAQQQEQWRRFARGTNLLLGGAQ